MSNGSALSSDTLSALLFLVPWHWFLRFSSASVISTPLPALQPSVTSAYAWRTWIKTTKLGKNGWRQSKCPRKKTPRPWRYRPNSGEGPDRALFSPRGIRFPFEGRSVLCPKTLFPILCWQRNRRKSRNLAFLCDWSPARFCTCRLFLFIETNDDLDWPVTTSLAGRVVDQDAIDRWWCALTAEINCWKLDIVFLRRIRHCRFWFFSFTNLFSKSLIHTCLSFVYRVELLALKWSENNFWSTFALSCAVALVCVTDYKKWRLKESIPLGINYSWLVCHRLDSWHRLAKASFVVRRVSPLLRPNILLLSVFLFFHLSLFYTLSLLPLLLRPMNPDRNALEISHPLILLWRCFCCSLKYLYTCMYL